VGEEERAKSQAQDEQTEIDEHESPPGQPTLTRVSIKS
jgi:hypothetical protein